MPSAPVTALLLVVSAAAIASLWHRSSLYVCLRQEHSFDHCLRAALASERNTPPPPPQPHQHDTHSAWTDPFPPLSSEMARQLAECGDGGLYTRPPCILWCSALANASVRTPKPPSMLGFTRSRVSCHHCPFRPPEPLVRAPEGDISTDDGLVVEKTDTLFQALEESNARILRSQSSGPLAAEGLWGRVLDAGTGESSLSWLLRVRDRLSQTHPSQMPSEIVAVTASDDMRRYMTHAIPALRSPKSQDYLRLVRGKWLDEGLLSHPRQRSSQSDARAVLGALGSCEPTADAGQESRTGERAAYEKFNVVILDYLLGAVDGFTPFQQHHIIPRIAKHMQAGSRMFVIGMEAYPDEASTPGGHLVLEVARVRDACILLARQRPYREYPVEWILDHLRLAGLTVRETTVFPIVYGEQKLITQLSVCENKLDLLSDPEDRPVRDALQRRIDALKTAIRQDPELRVGLCFGMDYLVSASCDSDHCGVQSL